MSMSKVKSGAEDVLAEQSELAGLAQGDHEVLDRQRILVADVDDALGGAGGEGADEHPLDDAVRIAFEQAAVHVGAGVALVGVADEEFLPRRPWPPLRPVPISGRWGSRRRRGRAVPTS